MLNLELRERLLQVPKWKLHAAHEWWDQQPFVSNWSRDIFWTAVEFIQAFLQQFNPSDHKVVQVSIMEAALVASATDAHSWRAGNWLGLGDRPSLAESKRYVQIHREAILECAEQVIGRLVSEEEASPD